jgi:hypothetical protein
MQQATVGLGLNLWIAYVERDIKSLNTLCQHSSLLNSPLQVRSLNHASTETGPSQLFPQNGNRLIHYICANNDEMLLSFILEVPGVLIDVPNNVTVHKFHANHILYAYKEIKPRMDGQHCISHAGMDTKGL